MQDSEKQKPEPAMLLVTVVIKTVASSSVTHLNGASTL